MMTTLSTNCNWWYCVRTGKATSPYWKLLFLSSIFKQLLLNNCAVDFVEICNVCTRKVLIKAAKRIFISDKICCSYYDFYFGVTFFGTHCINYYVQNVQFLANERELMFTFAICHRPSVRLSVCQSITFVHPT